MDQDNLVVLFYGSQTGYSSLITQGTAEDLAIRTRNAIATKLKIACIVLDPDDYDMDGLAEFKSGWLAGFFMATYGEGIL